MRIFSQGLQARAVLEAAHVQSDDLRGVGYGNLFVEGTWCLRGVEFENPFSPVGAHGDTAPGVGGFATQVRMSLSCCGGGVRRT